jgi:3-oxoisoapionate kinase
MRLNPDVGVLPEGLLLGFYGDDFTGSTAVLEALAFAGLRTILFFEEPDAAMLEKAGPCRAIGLAGLSRSKTPDWMDAHLKPALARLKALGAPLVHYKICSTFDSSPAIGSIGKAIEIALPLFENDFVPVLTGTLQIGRWQAFGTLFAAMAGDIFRIDRHPVMMRHPVTPIHEADLRRHLSAQTPIPVGLIDLVDLKNGSWPHKAAQQQAAGAAILLLDMIDRETLETCGAILWSQRGRNPFIVGSQGVEHALLEHWRGQGLIALPDALPLLTKVDHIAVVSGSCSPITAAQIHHAASQGFHLIRLDSLLALNDSQWAAELNRCVDEAVAAFHAGHDPLVYSAAGPEDPSIAKLAEALAAQGQQKDAISLRIGTGLGQILDALVRQTGIRRVVISGGDSSGQACLAMGLAAVVAHAPFEPSAPLCRALSHKPHLDGLEVVLKGGQMGNVDLFSHARG